MTLRQAALVAGFGLLVMIIAAPFAEFAVFAKLVVPGDVAATVENLRASRGLYLAGIFAYLVVFIFDVIVAWAFYVLLCPVNRSLSLLTAWFRLVYTAVALAASLKLVTVYRLLHPADGPSLPGSDQPEAHVALLQAQVDLLLDAFRHEWGFGLILFGIHLILLGYLVYRAGYIPRILGVLLVVAGLAWVIYELGPFLLPDADLGFLPFAFLGEPVVMLWLLIRGRRLGPQA